MAVSDQMTNNIDQPQPSLDDMLADVEAAWAEPYLMGELYGQPVWLMRADRMIKIQNLIFPVDHPYVRYTPVYAEAKRLLNETM